ncbi:Do family serine endopeptidase [Altererythrobacter sp. Root672]|uniref:Do family serine endopeptidase n=1 Tax=Altererythrobacter sp. Root672 TaxID=1736584 RepID=UPI0006F1FAC9|nr:Do family serine endopeptidase [Altererythrobacter sp. Root672]KRA80839.1 protease [Altererythrobacter sp. Root672]
MRYSYGVTTALLASGAAISLFTGQPAGAQVAQNDERQISAVVPRAGAPASFADLTAQLQPAVVNISTRQRITVDSNPLAGTPFADLFGNRGGGAQQAPQQPTTREAQSLGSGFIISADGYVVTNNHVIQPDGRAELEEVTVTMPDGTEYPAEVVGSDQASDLAVLKITRPEAFPFVHFGDSSQSRVGDWVIAIGNPFGLGGTVTSGIVSAVYRNTGAGGAYDRFIQTDASINRGNSGGPLFDMQGNVIGINNAIFSTTGGSVGIGFAIPAETAEPIVQKLIAGEEIVRGFLGVRIQPMNEDLAASLGLPENRGEFIQSVQAGEAAEQAGLRIGDVVVTVDGKPVTRDTTLSFIVSNIEPGKRINVEIIRNGQHQTLPVTVGRRPSEEELAAQVFNPDDQDPYGAKQESGGLIQESLGMQVIPLSPQIAGQLGLPSATKGVVVSDVDPNADAALKGINRGTVILSANNRDVTSAQELEAVISGAKTEGRKAVLLRVRVRGAPEVSVPVRLR